MKILLAYDGSECADAAIQDLKRAGLNDEVEVLVMSVADVFVPDPINDNGFPTYVPTSVRRAHEHGRNELEQAGVLAGRASEQIDRSFQTGVSAIRQKLIRQPGH